MSGAPSTQVPCPAKDTALHLRAEENGIRSASHPVAAGQAAAMASMVELGPGRPGERPQRLVHAAARPSDSTMLERRPCPAR